MNSGGRWWGRSKLPPMLWRMETAYSGLSPLLREVRLSIVMAGVSRQCVGGSQSNGSL